jgi:minor extracellular serine protease Vpr
MSNDSRTLRGRLRRTILLVSAAALAVTGIAPAAGATDQPAQLAQFERLDVEELGLAEIDLGEFTPRYLQEDRTVHVMVELEDRPIALERAAAQAQGRELPEARERALARALEREQDRLVGPLRSLGADVESQLQHAYNGMRIRVPASRIDEVAALPGVRAVRALEVHEPLNATSANHLGIPQDIWTDLGLTGEGVSVAIIDTGIDYTHANFGGEGTPEAFESNDPTIIEEGTFPTAKVVGGWDFVGDDYNASSDDEDVATPKPDPDPIDCNGHGTHVAGTVGGFGVVEGQTYEGDYAGLDPSGMDIGPGMAPHVDLYALKVFGCEGSTNVTVDAIDWAVENKVDVINMSLGSSFGRATDPSAVASTNAVEAGIVVVASAGNSGDVRYITGSPASSEGAISVAAMDTAFEFIPMAEMADVLMQVSNGAEIPDGEITANVHVLQDDPSTPANESLGCELSDYDDIADGDIVITFRGVCARVDRAIFGQQAGASAVVMVNDAAGLPPFEGAIPGVTIPFLGARGTDAGALSGLDGTEQTLAAAGSVENPSYEHFAAFTSAGPRNADGASKPDLTAPGVAVDSALVGTGSGGARFSGTSMAAPVVAGVAALVVESQPDWDAEQVKAAIVNSGSPAGVLDYRTTRGGSGLITPAQAVNADVVALGDPLTASLSFGVLRGTDADTYTKTVQLDGEPTSLDVAVEWSEAVNGVSLTTPDSVTVSGGTFNVSLDVDWSVVANYSTASGTLLLTDADHDLRVPFVAVLDPVSSIDTDVVAMPRRDGTTRFVSTNDSTVAGALDVYAWMLEDAEGDTFGTSDPEIDSPADIRAVGVQSFPDAFGAGESLAVVAINSHHPTSTAILNEYDVLWDVNRDGNPDYVTVGIDYGLVLGLGFIDLPVSLTFDLGTGAMVDAWLAVVDYDSSTILLPFVPENLGLAADGNTAIGLYGVATFSIEGYGDDWASAPRSVIDLYGTPPALEVGQFAVLDGGETVEWSATLRRGNLAQGVLGWMIVTIGDEAGAAEAELIPLDTGPRGGPGRGPGR